MTQEEKAKIKIDVTVDLVKTIIQIKANRNEPGVLNHDPDSSYGKDEIVKAALVYANKIVEYILG